MVTGDGEGQSSRTLSGERVEQYLHSIHTLSCSILSVVGGSQRLSPHGWMDGRLNERPLDKDEGQENGTSG